MNAPQRDCSSSDSDPKYANVDERKRKRMISNRESARRSRMRKQKQLADLTIEITNLQRDNARVRDRIDDTSQRYIEMESANNVLRARMMELTDRLKSVTSVLQIIEIVDGVDVEIPAVADPLAEPWMQPAPFLPTVQPVIASADVLNY